MKLLKEDGEFYLDEKGERVKLTPRELNLFRQMSPMGRRLTLRKHAVELSLSDPENPQINVMKRFAQFPAIEWSFVVPD